MAILPMLRIMRVKLAERQATMEIHGDDQFVACPGAGHGAVMNQRGALVTAGMSRLRGVESGPAKLGIQLSSAAMNLHFDRSGLK